MRFLPKIKGLLNCVSHTGTYSKLPHWPSQMYIAVYSEGHPGRHRFPLSILSEGWRFSIHNLKNHLHILKMISLYEPCMFRIFHYFCFETESHSITQASLECTMMPMLSWISSSFCLTSQSWDCRRQISDH